MTLTANDLLQMDLPLPDRLPIFPLESALLLPYGRLPLHIFEPRYRAMTADVLESKSRTFGIIHPYPTSGGEDRLQPVGCAGRIVSFFELDGGEYMLLVAGLSRFRVESELERTKSYREVVPNWDSYRADLKEECGIPEDTHRDVFKDLMKKFLAKRGLTASWEIFQNIPDSELITALAMTCPFNAEEKLELLETNPTSELGNTLLTLLREDLKSGPVSKLHH